MFDAYHLSDIFFGIYHGEPAFGYLEEPSCICMCVNIFMYMTTYFKLKCSQFFLMSWSYYFAVSGVSHSVILAANLSLSCFPFTTMS